MIGESEIEIRDAAETFSLRRRRVGEMFRAFLNFKFKNKKKTNHQFSSPIDGSTQLPTEVRRRPRRAALDGAGREHTRCACVPSYSSDRKVFVAGMLHVYENPNEVGELITYPDFTAFDIQDSKEYKFYLKCPFISDEPLIKQFVKIVRHKCWFSEDDEQSIGLVQI